MTLKHATSSVFVLGRQAGTWRLGLILHPRFGRLMMPGGHVEAGESAAEAALREVAEEAGLVVRLLDPPSAPLPGGYQPARVATPWWIVEYQVPADSHLAESHVHIDHLYVATAAGAVPGTDPAHPFSWHEAGDLAALRMFDDARILAAAVLAGARDAGDGQHGRDGRAGQDRRRGQEAHGAPGPGEDRLLAAVILARLQASAAPVARR